MSAADQSNNLYNYQEYYQQHQKQQEQHYQLQQQEMQQYGSYSTGGSGMPSSSLSQLTLPLTRSLYHSSVVSPLETSFMPVHTHNSAGRPHAHHQQQQQQHHQFTTTTLHPQHRSEESRGLIGVGIGGGGDNNSSSNSPPLSLVHGNSDLELSSYALDYQLQLQQSSRRSSSNQQLQQHSGRRNERRKYARKQHGERNNERKTKHRRAAGEARVRGGGLVSDTSDLLMTISNSGGGVIPTSGVTTPTLTSARRSAAETNAATLKFNQYRQDLGIPESYKISYPHYYEDAINPCPTDYPVTDPSANITNGTLGTNNSGSHQPRDRQPNRYVTGSGTIGNAAPPPTLSNNLPNTAANTHYTELPNHGKTTKSKRSSTGYNRAEQVLGSAATTRNTNNSPPATVSSTSTTSSSANTTTTTNGSSSSPSATTASATSAIPSGTHYAELHFRDVGREIDV